MKKVIFSTILLMAFVAVFSISSLFSKNKSVLVTPKNLGYRIVSSFPHDTKSFTQGLIYIDGFLYESTGLYGKSTLRKVDLNTGQVISEYKLPKNYFAEGITVVNNKIYQLTWKARKGFIYDIKDLDLIGNFSYSTDGWGITNDGKSLIMSDGSSYLYFLDPSTFKAIKKIRVIDRGEPVNLLNELEYIDGKIYSNIWKSNKIISVDPKSGTVLEWIDLTGLLKYKNHKSKAGVLNGIAYDNSGRLFVTGKYWSKLFEIEIVK